MTRSRKLTGGSSCVLNEAAVLLFGTLDHSITTLLVFSDQARLIIFAWIWDASLLFCLDHFLAVGETWHGTFVILSISWHLLLRPILNMIVLITWNPFFISCHLRKVVLFISICCTMIHTDWDFIHWCNLFSCAVELEAELWVSFRELEFMTIVIHISDFDTWLPRVDAHLGTFNSLTISMVVEIII